MRQMRQTCLLLAAALGTAVLLEAQGAGCGLGVRWSESENGIAGDWVRRGNSDVFDATWPGVRSVLTMTLTGNQLRIHRRDAGNQQVDYTAVIGPDGKTVTGTARVLPPVPAGWPTQPFAFQATIQCGEKPAPPPPSTPLDLGGTLVVVHPNVCVAIWTRTRPGVYDAVTVCQGPGNTSSREVLSVESNDGRSVVISRPKYGRYRGTLSTDRKTITGTCDWSGCTPGFDWTAYVDRDWRNSPPLK